METNILFKFPTIANEFSEGGGDFHPACNTSVESPGDNFVTRQFCPPFFHNDRRILQIVHRPTEILVPKHAYRVRTDAKYICPLTMILFQLSW
jgi:hypothetical protein